ncbi:MAG: hypothetical protein KDD64_07835 [Bdellovibrionales bacterium]|nr:hypothetical protein [Bdellovibrionales bacterium]
MKIHSALNFALIGSLMCGTPTLSSAAPLTEATTGLQVDAPKKFTLSYDQSGLYTIKKKKAKTKANFVIGTSPLSTKATADDYIASSDIKVQKYDELSDSILIKGKLGKKSIQVRFRPVGSEMEVITYFGKNGKKKKKRSSKGRTLRTSIQPRVTVREIALLDQIIRSRQGGRVVPLPITIPTRQLVGIDGTSALVPNLPGWTFDARDGIISGGNPTQGIVNLGIPTLVILPGFFNYGVVSSFTTAANALATVWPQQVATLGAQVQVLAIQQIPGTSNWLGGGAYLDSGLFAVRFRFNNRTWDGIFVSGCAPIDFQSWLWYHSYIAVPVNGSQAIANALVNTWSTWDNSNANAARLQDALNTIATTVIPGNPIDPDVFDAIHQKWVDYIRQ